MWLWWHWTVQTATCTSGDNVAVVSLNCTNSATCTSGDNASISVEKPVGVFVIVIGLWVMGKPHILKLFTTVADCVCCRAALIQLIASNKVITVWFYWIAYPREKLKTASCIRSWTPLLFLGLVTAKLEVVLSSTTWLWCYCNSNLSPVMEQ